MDNLFLTIDGINIEDVEEGGYTAYEQELGTFQRMISGRYIQEVRAKVWVVEIAYDEIDSQTMFALQSVLRSRRTHELTFLPSVGGTDRVTSTFLLTTLPQPSLTRWYPGESPYWSGFTLHFEEVEGHD